MYGLSFWDLAFYAISLTTVIWLFGRPESIFDKSKKTVLLKKVLWSLLILTMFYWTTTVPHIGSFINFTSNKIEVPIEKNEAQHLENHQRRILYLEQQLEQNNNELRELRQHYYLLLQIVMYGLLFYGITKITKSNEKELEEIKKESIFKL
jgi:TolA-binding protein